MNTVTNIMYVIICFVITCNALNAKPHYYFDTQEKKYYHLDNNLDEGTKRFLNQKIDSRIFRLKRGSVVNNLALLSSTIMFIAFCTDLIKTLQARNNDNNAHINTAVMLATLTGANAVRAYYFRSEFKKKIEKLTFKQSLLLNK